MRGSLFSLAGTGGRLPLVFLWILGIAFGVVAIVDAESPGLLPSTSLRAAVWIAFALFNALALFAWVRWLHGAGRSGYWALVGLVPYIGTVAVPLSLFLRHRETPEQRFAPATRYRMGAILILAVTLILASRAFWQPFTIPSENMAPTLRPGDYVVASTSGRWERGDVVSFQHPVTGQPHVARIVGLSGEKVQMQNGQLVIDGQAMEQTPLPADMVPMVSSGVSLPACANAPVAPGQTCLRNQAQEVLPNGRGYPVLDVGPRPLDTTRPFDVPSGHVFVLGDHRDNSNDSRIPASRGGIGTVPTGLIKGRVHRVVFNTNGLGRLWEGVR